MTSSRPPPAAVAWDVRLDANDVRNLVVLAAHWYDARRIAAVALGVDPSRVFVIQRT